MPTFESLAQFDRDFAALSRSQQEAFKDAVRDLVAELRRWEESGRGLPGKKIRNTDGLRELRWATDGRATWQLGPERRPGEAHVIWRRVGVRPPVVVDLYAEGTG